jgi:hypothetical protein
VLGKYKSLKEEIIEEQGVVDSPVEVITNSELKRNPENY